MHDKGTHDCIFAESDDDGNSRYVSIASPHVIKYNSEELQQALSHGGWPVGLTDFLLWS